MRKSIFLSVVFASVVAASGSAFATPITSLTPITSNGTDVNAVFVYSSAGDTLTVSEIAPNATFNFFCDYTNPLCTQSTIGQTVALGPTQPGLVFGLRDLTVPNLYTTDALAADGYAHDLVSQTVSANDADAVAAAYGIFGQGALSLAAANSIAALGEVPGTVVTFIGWEDRLGGDYDYNDLIFAFTDPPVPSRNVPEPGTIWLLAAGLLSFAAFGWQKRPLTR